MHPDPDELGPDSASFAHLLEVGSALEPDDFDRVEPPEGLWDSIAARLDEPAAAPAAEPEIQVVPEIRVVADLDAEVSPDSPGPLTQQLAAIDPDHVASDAALHRLDDRRRPRVALAAIAAAVVLLVVGGVAVTLRSQDTPEVVATTTLEVLEGPATAQAELVRTDGEDRLVVTAQNMPPAPPGTHYELWLVDPAVTDPHSLGPMSGSTEVTVPSTIDPTEYPVVDISLQENGSHVHSGHSLLRGTLQ